MFYLFVLIIICWILSFYFLRGGGGKKTLQRMREAHQEMEAATTHPDRQAAAKRVIAIIEQEHLAGIVVEDARKDAEAVLKAAFTTR